MSENRTLTIAQGATTSTGVVTITAVDDAVYTGDREVDVSGASSNAVGVTEPDDVTLTITDDEVLPVNVNFSSATYSVAESDDSTTTETRENEVTIKVTLSADPERSVTVPLTSTNQDGASNTDYSGVPSSVTFASGDTEKSFTFTATADDLDDDSESVKLGFGTLPDGVTAGTPDESVVSITDDDVPAGTVTLVQTPATIDESGTNNVSTVTATLSTASSAVTTITVSVPEDSPVTLSENRTLTIAQGTTTSAGAVTITAVDDAVYTGDREVDVSGASSNAVGVTDPDDATLTITDDEVLPVNVNFSSATYTVAESDDSTTTETRENEVTITVTLSADPERSVTVPLTSTNQDGASSADYSGVPASVTFASGDTEKSFTFAATADEVDDDGESVKLAFGTLPDGVTAGSTAEAVVSINDDDVPTVTASFGSATYSAAEGSSVEVKVTLSADPERSVTVPLTATNQGGASSADYSGVPET